MKKNIFLIISLLLCFISVCKAQHIIAGVVSVNDTYNDIIPDSSVVVTNYHLAPPGETMNLDIDNDGAMDFRISTWGGGGLGGGSGGCVISSLGGYASLVTHIDTVIGCCPDQYIETIADTFDFNDTISNSPAFSSSAYLFASTYGWMPGPSITSWANIGDHYIGIRLSYSNETLFGWIRVKGTGSFTLTVKDYACNINHYASINNGAQQNKSFVYPSPFFDRLNIITQSPELSEITIYDITSRKVIQQKFKNAIVLNTESLDKGIYIYEIKQNGQLVNKGKVVKE